MTPKKDQTENLGSRNCSRCGQQLTNVGAFWICPAHGQVAQERPLAPLRIFLSYGHDGNEDLVRQIKAELEKRGHDVWIDKSKIKGGDDWRRSITEGIVESQKFVAFLSKHSTRSPGVCLDEIAIALGTKGGNILTILVENEQEVRPPPSVGHVQWLDMHDWKERRSAGEEAWKKWYPEKIAEIVAVVESDENKRFAGEIEELATLLKPIKPDARINELLSKPFVGREWMLSAVEEWRCTRGGESRLFWIVGDPGVGKSAFAAHFTHYGRDRVIAVHFCEWNKRDRRDARQVVRNLAFQLAARLPDYRKLLLTLPEIAALDAKEAFELFDYLLATPLQHVIDGGRERYLIVIDALDEANEGNRNQLVELLAQHMGQLPDWLGVLATSRPETEVRTPLQGLAGLKPFILETGREENLEDIRQYLRDELASELTGLDGLDGEAIIENILEKSEGVFLYAEYICTELRRNHLSLDRLDEFPQGLGGIYAQYFSRQFPDIERYKTTTRHVLGVIAAAKEPLEPRQIEKFLDWDNYEREDFLSSVGSVFKEVDGKLQAFHKSLLDWLTGMTKEGRPKAGHYFVSAAEGHRRLAEAGWEEYSSDTNAVDAYFLRHLPAHLSEVGRLEELTELLCSVAYIQQRCHQTEAYLSLLEDYRRAKSEQVSADSLRRLVAMRSFVAEERRCLQAQPNFLFQQALNRPAGTVAHAAGLVYLDSNPSTAHLYCLNPPRSPNGRTCLVTHKLEGEVHAISRDGTLLLEASGAEIIIRDILHGQVVSEGRVPPSLGKQKFAAIADTLSLASLCFDNGLCVFDIRAKQPLWTEEGKTSLGRCCCFSADGTLLAIGSFMSFQIWLAGSGEQILNVWDPLQLFEGMVYTKGIGLVNRDWSEVVECKFDDDGERLATKSACGALALWQVPTGAKLQAEEDDIRRILGPRLPGNRDGSWHVGDMIVEMTGSELRLFDDGGQIEEPDGSLVGENQSIPCSRETVSSPYGNLILVGEDKCLTLFDVSKGDIVDTEPTAYMEDYSFSVDGEYLRVRVRKGPNFPDHWQTRDGRTGALLPGALLIPEERFAGGIGSGSGSNLSGDHAYRATLQPHSLTIVEEESDLVFSRTWIEGVSSLIWCETCRGPLIVVNFVEDRSAQLFLVKNLQQGALVVPAFRIWRIDAAANQVICEAGVWVICPRCGARSAVGPSALGTTLECGQCAQSLAISPDIQGTPEGIPPSSCEEIRFPAHVHFRVTGGSRFELEGLGSRSMVYDASTVNEIRSTDIDERAIASRLESHLRSLETSLLSVAYTKAQLSALTVAILNSGRHTTGVDYEVLLDGTVQPRQST